MQIIRTIKELRETVHMLRRNRSSDSIVGFVPTMGYLHQGHMSLMEKAHAECDITVLSIFVNPLQFGVNEDFSTYPRDEQSDIDKARQMKVDIVFIPDVSEMYPKPIKTKVSVSGVTEGLCGASRPGHFDGVSTVVMKLFQIVMPDRAYFGLKDAQQLAVIQQMVTDLNMNITVVPCPILREADGLAMSSRNVYLTEEERRQALVLSQALVHAERMVEEQPQLTANQLFGQLQDDISKSSLANIDYIEIRPYPSLDEINWNLSMNILLEEHPIIIALAVKFGTTRLIDNCIIAKQSVGGGLHV